MIQPICCFAHRIHNVLTITFMNKKIDEYFDDGDIDDIPDNIDQDEYLGDEFILLTAKRILLTIKYTKNLVKYVKNGTLIFLLHE